MKRPLILPTPRKAGSFGLRRKLHQQKDAFRHVRGMHKALIPVLLLIGLIVLTGCGKRPPVITPTGLTIPVRDGLRLPCPRPDRPSERGLNDRSLTAFSVQQEASISVCEARKDEAVGIIDVHNRLVEEANKKPPKRFWEFWK